MFAEIGRAPVKAEPPLRKRLGPSTKPRWLAPLMAQADHWLSGQAKPSAYQPNLQRQPSGPILSITISELAAALPSIGEGMNLVRRKQRAGEVLAALGWVKRYLTNQANDIRERRYFRPPEGQ